MVKSRKVLKNKKNRKSRKVLKNKNPRGLDNNQIKDIIERLDKIGEQIYNLIYGDNNIENFKLDDELMDHTLNSVNNEGESLLRILTSINDEIIDISRDIEEQNK
jgi:hypothetical protein